MHSSCTCDWLVRDASRCPLLPLSPLPIPDPPAPACCCCCENRAENESYGLPSQHQPCPSSTYGQIEGNLRPLSCRYIYIFRSERVRECPGSGQICNRGCELCAACRMSARKKKQSSSPLRRPTSTSSSPRPTARRGRARIYSTYIDVWPAHLSLKVSVQPTRGSTFRQASDAI